MENGLFWKEKRRRKGKGVEEGKYIREEGKIGEKRKNRIAKRKIKIEE